MIRDFGPADQGAVRHLILCGLRERWGESFDESLNHDLDDIEANYLALGSDVIVIEEASTIVATGTLLLDGPRRGRIVRMSVDAARRREGLGRRVVAELIERARQRGMNELVVLTDTPWESALGLYRACGFTEVGRDATDTHFAMTL